MKGKASPVAAVCFLASVSLASAADPSMPAAADVANPGSNPVLSAPGYTNGELSLRVAGESKATYQVLASSDAVHWTVVATNEDVSSTRLLSTRGTEDHNFVLAQRTRRALFGFGMAAAGKIDLNGNNVIFDSFDSADPTHSTNGSYDSSKAKDNCDIGSLVGITNSGNLGSLKIFGSAFVGTGGTIALATGGSIGSAQWHSSGISGVEPDHSHSDFVLSFPPAKVPFARGPYFTAPDFSGSTNIGGITYAQIYDTGNYKIDTWDLRNANRNVLIRGQVQIWLLNGFNTLTSSVNLAPGAKLTLYVGGPCVIGGNSGMNNHGDATKLMFYGLAGCSAISFGGNSAFTGCVYAPSANLSMNGGANNTTYDFRGAIVAGSVFLNGQLNLHFDENLLKAGPWR